MQKLAVTLKPLERALFAPYAQGHETHLQRGKLDPRRAYKAVQGNPYFFRRKDVREERRSAASLVLDFSSSMGADKTAALQLMVNGLSDLFDVNRVAYEVNGFSTVQPSLYQGQFFRSRGEKFKATVSYENEYEFHEQVREQKRMSAILARGTVVGDDRTDLYRRKSLAKEGLCGFASGTCIRLKSFDKPANKAALGNLRQFIFGGTNDAHVYRNAVRQIANRAEGTKIVLYLGDGAGNGMGFIRAVAQEARELGVITVGIGLGRSTGIFRRSRSGRPT